MSGLAKIIKNDCSNVCCCSEPLLKSFLLQDREGDYNQYRWDYNLQHAFSKKKPWHLRNLVLLFFQSLFYWSHPLRYENIYPCSFCPKIWISCAGSFTILFLYSRNSFQNNLDYSLLKNFRLLFVAPQNDVTNVLQHTPYSSAICINPWQMVGLCFHLWNSQFQVYWIGLHVKANCYTPRNLSCHILRVVWLIHQ